MHRKIRNTVRRVVLASAASVAYAAVAALTPAHAEPVEFNVPQQRLDNALLAFAAQANLQIVFDPKDVTNKVSDGVVGTLEPTDALNQILDGSDLSYGGGPKLVVVRKGRDGSDQRSSLPENPDRHQQVAQAPADAPGVARPQTVTEKAGSLEEIIVTSRRMETAISDVPSSVTVISAAELETLSNINDDLGGVLEFTVPGFPAATNNNLQTPAVLRGRTALILIDGVPQNQLLRSSGYDVQTVVPEAVERIEVLRGANAVYGFGASGGVINYVLKRPKNDEPEIVMKAGLRFQTEEVRPSPEVYGQVSGRLDRLGYLFGAGYEDRKAAYDGRGNLLRNDVSLDGKAVTNFIASLDYALTETQSIRLSANRYKLDGQLGEMVQSIALGNPVTGQVGRTEKLSQCYFDNDRPYSGVATDPTTLGTALDCGFFRYTNATLTYSNEDVLGSSVELVGLYHQFRLETPGEYFYFDTPPVQIQDRNSERKGLRATINTPLAMLTKGSSITWGVDYLDYVQDEAYILPQRGILTRQRNIGRFSAYTQQESLGVFGQLDVALTDAWKLTGGVRYEDYKIDMEDAEYEDLSRFTGGKISYDSTVWNAGVIYNPTDAIDVFASFSQGLDVTQVGRAAWQVPTAAQINPQPAVTNNYEIGTRARLGDWRLSGSVFYTDAKLASRTVAQTIPGQVGGARPLRQPEKLWGFEAMAFGQVMEDVTAGGTFTWQRGIVENANGTKRPIQNIFSAPMSVNLFGQWQMLDWLDARLQGRFIFKSDRFDITNRGYGNGDYKNEQIFDAAVTASLGERGSVTLAVDNLFDEVYVAPGDRATNLGENFFYAPGRTITLTYTVRFGGGN